MKGNFKIIRKTIYQWVDRMAGLEVEVITLGGEDNNLCNDQFGFYNCIFNLPNVIKKLYQLFIAGCGMPSNSCFSLSGECSCAGAPFWTLG